MCQAFNPNTITDHFKQLEFLYTNLSIPTHNIYNWDEKGLQLGGGRKDLGTNFIFDAKDKVHYYTRCQTPKCDAHIFNFQLSA